MKNLLILLTLTCHAEASAANETHPAAESPITTEMLSVLSAEQRQALRIAIEELNRVKVNAVLAEIAVPPAPTLGAGVCRHLPGDRLNVIFPLPACVVLLSRQTYSSN